MSDIFISYSREDLDAALLLAGELEKQGWSVFWDRAIPAGKSWRDVIGAALDRARCIVVLWSRTSIKSDWVLEEADYGRQRQILIPLLIERVEPPLGFRGIQAADLSTWHGDREDAMLQEFLGGVAEILRARPVVTDEERRKAGMAAKCKAEEQQRQRAEAEELGKGRVEYIQYAKRKAAQEPKRRQAWQNACLIRRFVWAGLLTIAISVWLKYLFPSHPPEAAATTVLFVIMFGLVYAVERLLPVVRCLASAVVGRSLRQCAPDSSKEGK